MAKAPKAPGSNGPGTAQTLIDEFTARADLHPAGDYWSCHVVTSVALPVAMLAGDAAARALLPRLTAIPAAGAEALALIAQGLAARGESAAATAAIEDAVAVRAREAIDGERGTIVWSAIARAHHALGDAAATDRALDEAHACARRETGNPTQPTPHLARALADTGRPARLLALLRAIGPDQIWSETERATERAIGAVVASGDARLLAEFHALLAEKKGHVFVGGVVEGARAAVLAGHGALLSLALDLLGGNSYLAGWSSLTAAATGDTALARALAERPVGPSLLSSLLADAFAALGDDAAAQRTLDALDWQEQSRELHLPSLALTLRLLRTRGTAAYQARVDAARAKAAARRPADEAQDAARLGLALVAAGDEAQGAPLLDAAVAAADAIPKAGHDGWLRNNALQLIGLPCASHDRWSPALLALKKSSAKNVKSSLVAALACTYARAHDPAGALLVLGYEPRSTLKGLMSTVDALSSLAGLAPPYTNHS